MPLSAPQESDKGCSRFTEDAGCRVPCWSEHGWCSQALLLQLIWQPHVLNELLPVDYSMHQADGTWVCTFYHVRG